MGCIRTRLAVVMIVSACGGKHGYKDLPDAAGPDRLDPTFGGDGTVTVDTGFDDRGRAVAVQPDGKIVIAGKSNNDSLMIRLLANGVKDPAFGTGGIVRTDIGGGNDEGKALAIETDGSIVLAGINTVGNDGKFSLARYTDQGVLDPAFSTDGVTTAAFGPGNDEGKAVEIQADGMIVMAGQAKTGSGHDFALARFDGSGQPDATFGVGGTVTSDFGGVDQEGNSVRQQADGKLVVAGYSGNAPNEDFAVVRYLANGMLDTSFGAAGIAKTAIGPGTDLGFAVAIQSDQRIVVAGTSVVGGKTQFTVVRYQSSGSLDGTFGRGGIVTTEIGASDECTAITLQRDGRIVLAGTTGNGTTTDFVVVRYNRDGSLDTSFGGSGMVTVPIVALDDGAYAVALQPDGNIVVVGEADNSSNHDLAVARLLADP